MSHAYTNPHSRRPLKPLRRAFTLLEVVVVITIIAILAALIAPRMLGWVGKSKQKAAKSETVSIAQTVKLYMLDHGLSKLPDGFDLMTLMDGPDPAFDNKDALNDPWGNPYLVRIPGEVNIDFDIVSYGADGQPGGEGENADVSNGQK